MKNYTTTLILWIIFQNFIFAQTDVKNWENIPWDISEQQIKEISKEKLIKLDKTEKYSNSYCNYIIENYQKYNSDFSVHFLMDENSNTLDCVQLKSNSIKSDVNAKVNDGNKLYDSVLSLMRDEYGEPSNNELSKYSKGSTWHFESTIISLSFMHIDDTDFFVFNINYQKAPQGFDFRETKWGFSKKQVIESEKLTSVIDKDNIVGYESSIAGMKCLVGYIFTNDKLTRAKYVIQETHTNKFDFIRDYKTLKSLLIKKYGTTILDNDQKWYNDLYKDDYQQWGFAISLGHLGFNSSWRTPKTKIDLVLSGDNYEISLVIEYTSNKFEGIEEKMEEQEILNKL